MSERSERQINLNYNCFNIYISYYQIYGQNMIQLIINILALWGIIAALIVLADITRDSRRNLKLKYAKKYRPKFKIGDIVIFKYEYGTMLCKVVNVYVNIYSHAIVRTYTVRPIKYGLNHDEISDLYTGTYGYDYFTDTDISESDLQELSDNFI